MTSVQGECDPYPVLYTALVKANFSGHESVQVVGPYPVLYTALVKANFSGHESVQVVIRTRCSIQPWSRLISQAMNRYRL